MIVQRLSLCLIGLSVFYLASTCRVTSFPRLPAEVLAGQRGLNSSYFAGQEYSCADASLNPGEISVSACEAMTPAQLAAYQMQNGGRSPQCITCSSIGPYGYMTEQTGTTKLKFDVQVDCDNQPRYGGLCTLNAAEDKVYCDKNVNPSGHCWGAYNRWTKQVVEPGPPTGPDAPPTGPGA